MHVRPPEGQHVRGHTRSSILTVDGEAVFEAGPQTGRRAVVVFWQDTLRRQTAVGPKPRGRGLSVSANHRERLRPGVVGVTHGRHADLR